MESNFPLETLPEPFQFIIQHKADIENWDKKTLAVCLLSASATTIGNTVKFDNGKWVSKPVFWYAIIGENGTKKTPIMDFAYTFIESIDKERMEEYESNLKEWENSEKVGSKPKPETYVLKDFTPESIIEAHKNNEKGLVIFQDELAGWIKNFNRYSGGGEKEQMLSLFNGKSLKVTRIGRDAQYIPESSVNVIGGIQPTKMNQINNQESQGDGFLQRFLFVRQIPTPDTWSFENVNQGMVKAMLLLFEEVFNYPETTFTMSRETAEIVAKWYDKANLEEFNNELRRGIQKKLETYLFRFCVVIEVLDQCESGERRTVIAPATMEKAIQLVEFFRAEALDFLEPLNDPLSREPEAFREFYSTLNGRSYTKKEILELIEPFGLNEWSTDTLQSRLNNTELFIKEKHGVYRKTIQDVK